MWQLRPAGVCESRQSHAKGLSLTNLQSMLLTGFLIASLFASALAIFPPFDQAQSILAPVKEQPKLTFDLTTSGRYVVDSSGDRVKMACLNWPAHMETFLPEALATASMSRIASQVRQDLGWNCIRLTTSAEMFRSKNWNQAISVRMETYMSSETRDLFYHFNPQFRGTATTVGNVLEALLTELQSHDLMVVLDNHVSKAIWCCGMNDGNRWFNDKYFNTTDWKHALTQMSKLSLSHPNVIGIGLRNEMGTFKPDFLSHPEWYRNIRAASKTVYSVNPQLLIVVGGLQLASWLRHLIQQPLFPEADPINSQIIYEFHYYNLIYINPLWPVFGQNATCRFMESFLNYRVAFMAQRKDNPHPVWISEFGFDINNFNNPEPTASHVPKHKTDPQWFECLSHWLQKNDFGWAWWLLPRKTYFRGRTDYIDTYGLLRDDGTLDKNMITALKPLIDQAPAK